MLRQACAELATSDPRLGSLFDKNGLPPLRLRPEGFATLVHLILQQQVSRASAQAVFDRLTEEVPGGEVTARGFLDVNRQVVRATGFSSQKIDYVTQLADRAVSGRLDLPGLGALSDDEAISVLRAERGIGAWTASVYVLTALGRPDVWAPGDRALLVSLGRMLGRGAAAGNDEAIEIAEGWRPWRAVAARLLWHDYSASEAR